MDKLSEQSAEVLRDLHVSGGRLYGRFDHDVPFLRIHPAGPERNNWVPTAIVEELLDSGFIRIDETVPPCNTMTLQMSSEGEEYLSSVSAVNADATISS